MTGRSKKAAQPLPYRLLVASRVVAARSGSHLRFQALDGRYVEGIAAHFQATIVAAQTVVDGENETYSSFARYTYRFRSPSIRVLQLPVPSASSPGLLATLGKQLRQALLLRNPVEWCDLAIVFLPSYVGVMAACWCRIVRRPYAAYVGGDWGGYSPLAFRWRGWRSVLRLPYGRLNAWLEGFVVRGSTLAIVSGSGLAERYGATGKPVVATEPLSAFGVAGLFPREDTCLGEGCRLLFVGALLPAKGVQHLLRALALLPGVTLDVVGTGPADFQAELRGLAAAAGVDARVRWQGYVADPAALRDVYRAADIFVLPTLSEGSPRVVWEAMSQGLPVVVSDIAAIRATLEPERDVLLAPPADPAGIAVAIRRLIEDGDLRRRLIARGLAMAKTKLRGDPAKQAARLLTQHVLPRIRA